MRVSGIDVELRREGTLVLALTADDRPSIAHRLEFQQKLGLPLEWLSAPRRRAARAASGRQNRRRRVQPAGSSGRQPQACSAALRVAAEAAGVAIREQRPVKEISVAAGRATGVVFEDGTAIAADVVVLAAGAWSRSIAGLPPDRRPPVRPVKGQMLALRMDSGRAAAQSRAVGARRLSRAAPRRPSDHRRHRRGKRL